MVSQSAECLSWPMIQKTRPVTLTSYGQALMGVRVQAPSAPGFYRSCASHRTMGSAHRAGWFRGEFYIPLPGQRKPYNRPDGRGNAFPLWWLAPPPCPVGSMSLDSRVAGLPYESSSFATSAVRWGGKRKAPLNFSFPLEGKCHIVAKGCTRVNIPMKLTIVLLSLTSPHLEVLCGTSTVLHTSRGRTPGARPGGVSRSRTEPLAPRAKGPAAPSTLTPVRGGEPSGIPASTA